jgi:hypothetical protein
VTRHGLIFSISYSPFVLDVRLWGHKKRALKESVTKHSEIELSSAKHDPYHP